MITITGVGLVSCLGNNTSQNFQNFQKGICGSREITGFCTQKFHIKNAYEISTKKVYENNIKSWIISVINEALSDSKDFVDENTIIVVGTGLRNIRKYEDSIVLGYSIASNDLDFKEFLLASFPNVKDVISITNACSSSLYALSLGCDLLNLKLATKVIVVGADCISQTMHALDDRVVASKPTIIQSFDKSRKGVLLGEGAAAIVIKNKIKETKDNTNIYIKSVALTCDACHETQPWSEMIEKTIEMAITQADLSPQNIDLIFSHGTGTVLNDIAEGKAMSNIFQNCDKTLVTGLKPMIGHTSGASGLMSIVVGYMSLKCNKTIPLINMNEAIDEAKNLHFVHKATSQKLVTVQVNAFGFGGLNAVAIIGK